MQCILHDWGDEDCVKVIIVDVVLDPTSSMDLQTLLRTGGKERTEEEWKKLIQSAGYKGYKIKHVSRPFPINKMSLLFGDSD